MRSMPSMPGMLRSVTEPAAMARCTSRSDCMVYMSGDGSSNTAAVPAKRARFRNRAAPLQTVQQTVGERRDVGGGGTGSAGRLKGVEAGVEIVKKLGGGSSAGAPRAACGVDRLANRIERCLGVAGATRTVSSTREWLPQSLRGLLGHPVGYPACNCRRPPFRRLSRQWLPGRGRFFRWNARRRPQRSVIGLSEA